MPVNGTTAVARRLALLRSAPEAGFTMAAVMVGALIMSLLAVSAFAAVRGDTNLTRADFDRKQAYEAAKAGVDDYLFHLNADSGYWTLCTSVPTPSAVNQQGSTTKRRFAPGSTSASYAIELLPATGQSSCSTTNPVTSMIEQSGTPIGTFRIRSTGYSKKAQERITTTFKRGTFLDYMYFTQLETSDPVTYGDANTVAGAYQQCTLSMEQGRYDRAIPNSGGKYCDVISFITQDVINGPLHTNDAIAICGSPDFGRNSLDSIEVGATFDPGWFGSCSNPDPDFIGTFRNSAAILTPPPSNAQLANIAQSSYKFTGQVKITLNGTSMTVVTSSGTVGPLPFPSNGVVYVKNGTCSSGYTPFNVTYPSTSGCGNAYVKGNYSGQLTIAAENDVVVDGSLNRSGSGLLGLIANNFVRVYHPCSSGTNGTGSLSNLNIDAAILSVNHSFIVDNYNCGATLGTLTVEGAIAQKFRGPVGTFGSSPTGYQKNYVYDDRLKYLEPPSFIDPVQSAWVISRQTTD